MSDEQPGGTFRSGERRIVGGQYHVGLVGEPVELVVAAVAWVVLVRVPEVPDTKRARGVARELEHFSECLLAPRETAGAAGSEIARHASPLAQAPCRGACARGRGRRGGGVEVAEHEPAARQRVQVRRLGWMLHAAAVLPPVEADVSVADVRRLDQDHVRFGARKEPRDLRGLAAHVRAVALVPEVLRRGHRRIHGRLFLAVRPPRAWGRGVEPFGRGSRRPHGRNHSLTVGRR